MQRLLLRITSHYKDYMFIAPLLPTNFATQKRIKAKKPSWKIGSSFSLKALPKVQVSDDLELIDEDTLLTEEDLKKPQLPLVGDCEVGTMRKACKNRTCGSAEAEQKGEKLVLTMNQLNNPQSASGNCGLGVRGCVQVQHIPLINGNQSTLLADNLSKIKALDLPLCPLSEFHPT